MSTPDALPILPQHEATHTHGGNCSYAPKDKNRTIKRFQIITIYWMLIECSVALAVALDFLDGKYE